MPNFLTVKVLAYIAGVLGVVIIGLCVALWAQGVRVGKAQNQRDEARNQVEEAKRTIAGYQDAVKQCNAATEKLKTVAAEKAAAADQALARAQQEARKYQEANKRRAVLLAGPTPSGAGCSQAIATLRPELGK